jgi:hypothetical protein
MNTKFFSQKLKRRGEATRTTSNLLTHSVMKKTLALVIALAATIGTAAAQGSRTSGASNGTSSNGANGNLNTSSGNSSNTSSTASNNNPTTATPNYKPAPGTSHTPKSNSKGASKAAPNQVVSSGGQGHNSTRDPKGKVLVAPSVTTGKGSKK